MTKLCTQFSLQTATTSLASCYGTRGLDVTSYIKGSSPLTAE